jgi:hypothetical protein
MKAPRGIASRPASWAIACGLALFTAVVLPSRAPDALFWGLVALSCVAAALATWLPER